MWLQENYIIYILNELWEYTINPLIFSSLAIVLCYIYIRFVEVFFKDTVINRLTKASFEVDFNSILDLSFSYFVTLAAYMYLFNNIYRVNQNESFSYATIFGFALVYIGRAITKSKGVSYGRVFFYGIFMSFLLLLFYNVFLSIVITYKFQLVELIKTLPAVIDGVTRFYGFMIIWFIIGSVFLASVGELVLSMANETPKSLLCIADLFPADLRIITGLQKKINYKEIKEEFIGERNGIDSKLEEILNDKKFSYFICITRSIWIVERINNVIRNKNMIIKKEKCKILKSTYKVAIKAYIQYKDDQDLTLEHVLSKRTKIIKDYIIKYKERCNLLAGYNVREYDMGDLDFIISVYSDNRKEILFLVRDTSPRPKRVGLLSKERYLIDLFEIIFDNAWNQAKVFKQSMPINSEQTRKK